MGVDLYDFLALALCITVRHAAERGFGAVGRQLVSLCLVIPLAVVYAA